MQWGDRDLLGTVVPGGGVGLGAWHGRTPFDRQTHCVGARPRRRGEQLVPCVCRFQQANARIDGTSRAEYETGVPEKGHPQRGGDNHRLFSKIGIIICGERLIYRLGMLQLFTTAVRLGF